MNFKMIGKITGSAMIIEAVCLILMMFVSLIYREDASPFLYTIAILVVLGGLLSFATRKSNAFSSRGGFASTVLIWLAFTAFGALPFWFCGQFESYTDCFFEAMSGFTTTGASILTDIEALPKGILMWRSFTHFIGGMGILVLTAAILPSSGSRAHYLMQAEVPGPTADKLVPSLAKSSKILYSMYVILTIIECICLLIAGLPLYDSINISFSTAGTGGFCVLNNSIAGYENEAVEVITSIFMLLFSINFSIYFLLLTGKFKQAFKSSELKVFLGMVAASVFLICLNVNHMFDTVWDTFRNALFIVASTISTTGFCLPDYALWPSFAQTIIIIIMLCGACAGSTGGGIKTSRVIILYRSIEREIKQIIHPHSVNIIRVDGKAVDKATVHSVLRFVGAYFVISFIATLLVSLDNFDFSTNFSAIISCMSNVGPGFSAVGPTQNYSIFSDLSKWVCSACMLIGRLEIFPILIFFTPSTWKRT